MRNKVFLIPAMTAAACLVAGCASDTGGLSTSSLLTAPASTSSTQAGKVDPVCVSLLAQIDGLRKEGVTTAVEKASTGKTKTVSVKRESLAKITQLDKANAEFQAKCSTLSPKPAEAMKAPAPAAAPVKPVAAVAPQAPASAPAIAAAPADEPLLTKMP